MVTNIHKLDAKTSCSPCLLCHFFPSLSPSFPLSLSFFNLGPFSALCLSFLCRALGPWAPLTWPVSASAENRVLHLEFSDLILLPANTCSLLGARRMSREGLRQRCRSSELLDFDPGWPAASWTSNWWASRSGHSLPPDTPAWLVLLMFITIPQNGYHPILQRRELRLKEIK